MGYDRSAAVAHITQDSLSKNRWPVDNEPSSQFPIFTRANIGEVFPEVVKPFSWTLWGIPHSEPGWRQALFNLGAFDLEEFTSDRMEMLSVFGGYGYLNVSASRILELGRQDCLRRPLMPVFLESNLTSPPTRKR